VPVTETVAPVSTVACSAPPLPSTRSRPR
jgi:hypothetical protein